MYPSHVPADGICAICGKRRASPAHHLSYFHLQQVVHIPLQLTLQETFKCPKKTQISKSNSNTLVSVNRNRDIGDCVLPQLDLSIFKGL